ncbi:hypothetical protein Cgig2_011664 [Carnegiea gigantea]|uniref:Uncharacterized protein n=1 Tax=Carnegiea gigantea TaxID=171969 RepID=A0A9Q1JXJ8_9CARY|nr:hypothetical protein Cgig2_011664 [Carnegiea gigantea]
MALDSEYCDENRSEVVDREKFKVELRAVMVKAIGKMWVNVVVEEGSLMMKVYQGEGNRIEKEKEEKMKKIEMIIRKSGDDQEGEREINSKIVGPKKKILDRLVLYPCNAKNCLSSIFFCSIFLCLRIARSATPADIITTGLSHNEGKFPSALVPAPSA